MFPNISPEKDSKKVGINFRGKGQKTRNRESF